jgi:hypothetical protein
MSEVPLYGRANLSYVRLNLGSSLLVLKQGLWYKWNIHLRLNIFYGAELGFLGAYDPSGSCMTRSIEDWGFRITSSGVLGLGFGPWGLGEEFIVHAYEPKRCRCSRWGFKKWGGGSGACVADPPKSIIQSILLSAVERFGTH